MTRSITVYVDPPNHQQGRNLLFDREANPYAGDNILAPFIAVHDRLVGEGYRVVTADQLPDQPDGNPALLISFGVPDRLPSHTVRRYQRLAKRENLLLSAFFAIECPVVEPTMYEQLPRIGELFRRVFSWSDSASLLQFTRRPLALRHFCWPQSFDAVHEALWSRQDRRFLVMMNANKLPRAYVDELYTARLDAVEFFSRFGEIDLYGRGWDGMPMRVGKTRTPATLRRLLAKAWPLKQKLFPDTRLLAAAAAWRGAAKSKSETISRYRFALCFENSVLKGWMTEKLFDCFFAGTVPIYWGAPEVLEYVPAECFIDMRQFADFGELRRFLHSLSPADDQRYREAARDYLGSRRFDPFRLETFVDRLSGIVAEDAQAFFARARPA